MDDAVGMHETHGRDELSHDLTRLGLREPVLPPDPFEQLSPPQQFQNDVRVGLVVVHVVEVHDVRVTLASSEEVDFVRAVQTSRDDLHSILLTRLTMNTFAADGEAPVAEDTFLQVDLVVFEERRILKEKRPRRSHHESGFTESDKIRKPTLNFSAIRSAWLGLLSVMRKMSSLTAFSLKRTLGATYEYPLKILS